MNICKYLCIVFIQFWRVLGFKKNLYTFYSGDNKSLHFNCIFTY